MTTPRTVEIRSDRRYPVTLGPGEVQERRVVTYAVTGLPPQTIFLPDPTINDQQLRELILNRELRRAQSPRRTI